MDYRFESAAAKASGADKQERMYLCIDLKSFFASVECADRGLDPMTTDLVVADPERERGTICLAVSPSLKAKGVKNRCRLFEIPSNLSFIQAPPRMQLYIDYAAEIYGIYLKYISKDDIHVYSIDEAFLDVTTYLTMYGLSAHELAIRIMKDIKDTLGITATCGIGTNLYLCKIALDITAKHSKDFIGYLDEETYQRTLWRHRPLTDFWRIGPGIARRLESVGMFTMEDVAKGDEKLLYKLLGVDAEYLIDHAWGRECCTIAEIKAFKAKSNCLSSGQVLMREYSYEEARTIVKEMVDLLCLELVDQGLVTNHISLHIGHSITSLELPKGASPRLTDREILKQTPFSGASMTIPVTTNSVRILTKYFEQIYDTKVNTAIPIKRVSVSFGNVVDEGFEQYDLFTDPAEPERDRKAQQAVLDIKKKFGKNAIVKGMDLVEHATTMDRNRQIGGHKSGV